MIRYKIKFPKPRSLWKYHTEKSTLSDILKSEERWFFFFIKINQTKPRTKHLKILFVGVNVNLKRMKEKKSLYKNKRISFPHSLSIIRYSVIQNLELSKHNFSIPVLRCPDIQGSTVITQKELNICLSTINEFYICYIHALWFSNQMLLE